MSQILGSGLSGGGTLLTLTASAGAAVGPSGAGDIKLLIGATNNLTTVGTPGQNKITFDIINSPTFAGTVSANQFDTVSDLTKGLSLFENYIYAIGTDPGIDIGVVPKGVNGEFVIDGLWGGVLSAQWRTFQASTQTADAVQKQLSYIDLGAYEMITVKAVINGFKSTYDHCLSGEIMISAYRPAGGNITAVGAKVINSYVDPGATAGIDIDAVVDIPSQSVLLMVTGAVGETWNFVTTTSYMYTTHP